MITELLRAYRPQKFRAEQSFRDHAPPGAAAGPPVARGTRGTGRPPLNRPETSRMPARASRAATLVGASQAAGAAFRARATPGPGIYGLTALTCRWFVSAGRQVSTLTAGQAPVARLPPARSPTAPRLPSVNGTALQGRRNTQHHASGPAHSPGRGPRAPWRVSIGPRGPRVWSVAAPGPEAAQGSGPGAEGGGRGRRAGSAPRRHGPVAHRDRLCPSLVAHDVLSDLAWWATGSDLMSW
jgi:hypothetical protein